MIRMLSLLSALILLLSLTQACGTSKTDTPNNSGPGEIVQSQKTRVQDPSVSQGDLDSLVEGNNRFAFDLYQQAKKGETGNLFYSPYSISVALAMTWAGAKTKTETQMKSVLQFLLGQDALHPAFNALDLELQKRGKNAKAADGKGFRLNIVNALWGQSGYEWLDSFLDKLALNYGAGLRLLDFAGDPDGSRTTINNWVEEKTEKRIKDLLPEGSIGSSTVLVLTNAIYFNAAWQNPFDENFTRDGEFTTLDGTKVSAKMMNQEAGFSYFKGSDYQAVELPYDGREMSMLIVLPDEGKFDAVEQNFDTTTLKTITDGLTSKTIRLSMPRFEFEKRTEVKKLLLAMGLTEPFGGSCDLSGMNGTCGLMISDVLHKAFIKLNEEGTEAAAATAVVIVETSVPVSDLELKIDRPFLFLIRDNATNTVLFVGRIANPS